MLGEDGCARAPSSGGECRRRIGRLKQNAHDLALGLAELPRSMQKLLDKSQLQADHNTL